MNKKPLILITNDDGVQAPGLKKLIDCVADMGDVVAIAPDGANSGQSSAITVDRPLRVVHHDDYNGAQVYSITGTPVDCVKLGIHAVLGRRPDLILSGINHGSNSGNSIIYSGTMGAVLEGCMIGVPSVGYSYHTHSRKASLDACEDVIRSITRHVIDNGLPTDICLNVNIPVCDKVKGYKVVRAARGYWTEEYKDYVDPTGRKFYWLTGRFHNVEPDNPETDLYWTDRGYASVVPARPDQSAVDAMAELASMVEE